MLRTLVPKPRKKVKIQLVQRIRGVNGLNLGHHYFLIEDLESLTKSPSKKV